ncbi:unnamed protein product [Brachionus calyciflorus]|uniref:Uncharacterized protein n=1 Tax=Brachionus calyciflorus TaxID=104777 RepID=A0A813WIE4_9BILA|nr:unnamed protein product [Brachionus calyciflorus]
MQKFPISKKDYKKILESSVPVQDRPSFLNIKVKWILPIFQSKVEENENLNFRLTLIQKNAILYTEQARDGTPHVRIDAYCQLCAKNERCMYTFNIIQKPKEEENYIDVFWKKTREHNHKDNFRQQRGEKRVELYQDLVLNHFGSAKRMKYDMLHDDSNYEISEDVIRQIKHEQKYDFEKKLNGQVLRNSDWYVRLKSVNDSINLTMGNDYLNGYIESIRDTPFYEMILLSQKQLECIKTVPEDERILYVDATGGLVKIPKSELEATSEASIESNEFYNPDVAHFLQERFMPYCFIWSSLTLSDLPLTRETNGQLKDLIQASSKKIRKCLVWMLKKPSKSESFSQKKEQESVEDEIKSDLVDYSDEINSLNETNLKFQVNKYDLTKKMIDDLLNDQWLSASAFISCKIQKNTTFIIPNSIGQKILLSGEYFKILRNFCSNIDELKEIEWSMKSPHFTKQPLVDTNNCGVFICIYCDMLLNNQNLKFNKDMKEVRQEIFSTLNEMSSLYFFKYFTI